MVTEAVTGRQNSERLSQSFLADEHGVVRWQRGENEMRVAIRSGFHRFPCIPHLGRPLGQISRTSGPCAVAEPLHYIETVSIARSDVILCAIPMSHAYGYACASWFRCLRQPTFCSLGTLVRRWCFRRYMKWISLSFPRCQLCWTPYWRLMPPTRSSGRGSCFRQALP